MQIALVVGDTAGHTYPAIAVADACRMRDMHASVVFFGTSDSIAASLVRDAQQPFIAVPGSPIRGANVAGLARAAADTMRSVVTARRALTNQRTQLVMSFGGFASGGVIIAARTLGLPTAIFEANVEFGLANRWLRPWVDRVFRGLGPDTATTVGVPVRAAVQALANRPRRQPPARALRIFVASGSRGATFLADRLPAILGQLVSDGIRIDVRQQAPAPHALQTQYASLGVRARIETFVGDIATAYAWADVAIARGGASTIAELAIAGVPALLVPLADASADHQAANTALWEQRGAGMTLSEHAWNADTVAKWLRQMATDESAWCRAADAARHLARPDAAAHIADACTQIIRGRG